MLIYCVFLLPKKAIYKLLFNPADLAEFSSKNKGLVSVTFRHVKLYI